MYIKGERFHIKKTFLLYLTVLLGSLGSISAAASDMEQETEVFERGYNLPVEESQREEIKKECREVLKLLKEQCQSGNKNADGRNANGENTDKGIANGENADKGNANEENVDKENADGESTDKGNVNGENADKGNANGEDTDKGNINKEIADKRNTVNTVLTEECVQEMAEVLGENGLCVSDREFRFSMKNYERMEEFLNRVVKGEECEAVLYEIQSGGSIRRKQFLFDGKDMYVLECIGIWENGVPSGISDVFYTRIRNWEYTQKGWFCYEVCTPQPPEVSEHINGNCIIRIKPFQEEALSLAKKWLRPIGYIGNNLFCSQWDSGHLDDLDFNGLYESLYFIEHQEVFDCGAHTDGIPKEEFENVMTEYLPVSAEKLQASAVYDAEAESYGCAKLWCGNYSLSIFTTAVPEITAITENEDGTFTFSVDAVCEMAGSDALFSHELTVRFREDGGIEYLNNRIFEDDLAKIPPYRYRL